MFWRRTKSRTYYYFAFRVGPDCRYDLRCPHSGVVVQAVSHVEAMVAAISEAQRHLPCKDREWVVCHPVEDRVSCHHAQLMQDDWRRALRKFEEFMTVS